MTPDELEDFATRLCARLVERWETKQAEHVTVETFGRDWTSGKLYQRHGEVRGLRPKKSAKDDASRLETYVYPLLGSKAVAEVTEGDIETVLAEAPRSFRARNGRDMSQATKLQVYQAMRRLFELAVKPGRLRPDNPVSPDARPRKGRAKLFGYLYPEDFLALLRCENVPLVRRVLYVLAVYTGLRKGSLYALRWSGADLRHGTLTSLESKTGLPQLFEVRDGVTELLSRWHAHRGGPDGDEAIIWSTSHGEREADDLRAGLRTAGITRDMLFGGHEAVQPIRFHDLRATFITWARREGRGWGWITDRSGHVTPAQVDRYNRGARVLADLRFEPFPRLEDAVPELWSDETAAKVVRLR